MWRHIDRHPGGEAATGPVSDVLGTAFLGEPEGPKGQRVFRGPRYRRSDWHHPRVFRSTNQYLWRWECRCGASSYSPHFRGQPDAAIAALVHVSSQSAA